MEHNFSKNALYQNQRLKKVSYLCTSEYKGTRNSRAEPLTINVGSLASFS